MSNGVWTPVLAAVVGKSGEIESVNTYHVMNASSFKADGFLLMPGDRKWVYNPDSVFVVKLDALPDKVEAIKLAYKVVDGELVPKHVAKAAKKKE